MSKEPGITEAPKGIKEATNKEPLSPYDFARKWAGNGRPLVVNFFLDRCDDPGVDKDERDKLLGIAYRTEMANNRIIIGEEPHYIGPDVFKLLSNPQEAGGAAGYIATTLQRLTSTLRSMREEKEIDNQALLDITEFLGRSK